MTDPTLTRSGDTPPFPLATLVALLDVVVLERLEGGAFRRLGDHPPPAWFREAFEDVDPAAPVTLIEAFPVLDAFLSEAEIFWDRTGFGRLEGEAFVAEGPGGRHLPLAAVAAALDGRQFLLIQRVAGFDDRQKILQRAREQALAQEGVVKRIDALRLPLARATRLVDEMKTSDGLSGEQQETRRSAIAAELDKLRQALEELPKLPPGQSPRRR